MFLTLLFLTITLLSTVHADSNPITIDYHTNFGILSLILFIEIILIFLFITWNFLSLIVGIITDIIGIPLLMIIFGMMIDAIGDTTAFIILNLFIMLYFLI